MTRTNTHTEEPAIRETPRWVPLPKHDSATSFSYRGTALNVVWGYMWRLLGDEAGVEGAQQRAAAIFREVAMSGAGLDPSASYARHRCCWEATGCYAEHLLYGIGVDRDEAKGIRLMFEAADNGDKRSCLLATRMLAQRRAGLLEEAMDPRSTAQQGRDALTRANRLLKAIATYAFKALKGGFFEALSPYADALFDMGDRDGSALVCYAHLAHAGDPHGCCRVGWMLVIGRGTRPHEEEGWAFIRRAAELGDAEALTLLASRKRPAA